MPARLLLLFSSPWVSALKGNNSIVFANKQNGRQSVPHRHAFSEKYLMKLKLQTHAREGYTLCVYLIHCITGKNVSYNRQTKWGQASTD